MITDYYYTIVKKTYTSGTQFEQGGYTAGGNFQGVIVPIGSGEQNAIGLHGEIATARLFCPSETVLEYKDKIILNNITYMVITGGQQSQGITGISADKIQFKANKHKEYLLKTA